MKMNKMRGMLSILAISVLATCCGGTMRGQAYNNGQVTTKIITGTVVDKSGRPVGGAYVNATNGAETVETLPDGSYSIEVPVWLKRLTASYPGLGAMDVEIKDMKVIDFRFAKKLKVAEAGKAKAR